MPIIPAEDPYQPAYLCIETNYNQDKFEPSPNFGFPFCSSSKTTAKGSYIRMLGPFDIFDIDTKTNDYTLKECSEYNFTPFYIDSDGKQVNTTKGWYAVCQFNKKEKVGVSIELDYPPIRSMYPAAMGPFDTKEIADAVAAQYITPKCLRKYQEASEVCSPKPIGVGNIDICCSLLGSALNWPMDGGTLQLMFTPALCDDADASNRMQATYNKLNNKCMPMVQIPLGCMPTLDPIIQTCWNGVSDWIYFGTNLGDANNPIPRGYTIRFAATMCVTSLTTVSIDVNMQWLVNPYDINPSQPPQDPAISSCGSFSTTLNLIGSPTKHQNRIYTSHEGYGDTFKDKPIKFKPSCGYLQNCMGSVIPMVVLIPKEFGCNGLAADGPLTEKRCSLDDDNSSMACLQALIEPLKPLQDVARIFAYITSAVGDGQFVTYTCVSNNLDVGQTVSIQGLTTTSGNSLNLTNVIVYSVFENQFVIKNSTVGTAIGEFQSASVARDFWQPQFFSLGVNRAAVRSKESGEIQTPARYGCLYAESFGGITTLYPTPGNYDDLLTEIIAEQGFEVSYTNPAGGTITISDRDAGIQQQIQLGSGGGFTFLIKRIIYEIPDPLDQETKITKYSPLFVALLKQDSKNPFKQFEKGTLEIIQTVGPWMAKCTFPENNAVVHLYGFSFPPPILEECPGGYPNVSSEMPPVDILPNLQKDDYIKMLQSELEQSNKICIYRGNAIPNTKACCGASPSFECEKHGRCKQYGIAGPEDNMVCSSCPDFS